MNSRHVASCSSFLPSAYAHQPNSKSEIPQKPSRDFLPRRWYCSDTSASATLIQPPWITSYHQRDSTEVCKSENSSLFSWVIKACMHSRYFLSFLKTSLSHHMPGTCFPYTNVGLSWLKFSQECRSPVGYRSETTSYDGLLAQLLSKFTWLCVGTNVDLHWPLHSKRNQ